MTMADLLTGRSKGVIEHFVQTRAGSILVANGLEPVYRWDGQASSMSEAGVVAPATAMVMVGSGIGTLLGPFYAYERFQDRFGNWSDLSPISEACDGTGPASKMGLVIGATNATPVVVTTNTAHGLTTGTKIRIYGVSGNTAANADSWVNVLTTTTFELYADSLGTIPVAGNGTFSGVGYWASNPISNVSGASGSMVRVTFTSVHGMSSNQVLRVRGVQGMTCANGDWQVVVVSTTAVDLYKSVSDGSTYTSGTGQGAVTAGNFGHITSAANTTPIYIATAFAHGMSNGCRVRITGVEGNDAANGDWYVTVYDLNHFWLDDSAGNGTHVPNTGIWYRAGSQINYYAVPIPTESKVNNRQILRNTPGQTRVFYVDVETADMAATSFTSTNEDSDLSAEEAVSISETLGKYALPPANKPFLAQSQDRVFAAGTIDYSSGHIKVTNGSATVYGVGTAWTSSMSGRILYVQGASLYYTITSVNTSGQTLTLDATYGGSTSNFALYAIRPSVGDRKTVYWSEPGAHEAFDLTSGVAVAEDGDDITGLMSFNTFIYILENQHVYKFTFGDDPATDGAIYHQLNRGCVNNRCWVLIDDMAYLLANNGIYRYGGDRSAESISDPIQTLWWSKSKWRINWNYKALFSSSLDQQRSIVRWFVSLSGSPPRWAIAYNYQLNRFWIEEYQQPILSAATATIGSDRVQLAGSYHRKVMAISQRDGDVVQTSTPNFTYRGTATAATNFTLADSAATFDTTNAVNAPLFIVDGTGKGQVRRVVSLTSTALTINRPWSIKPDSTSVYQLGGIAWHAKGKWLKLSRSEEDQQRRIELAYLPTTDDADFRFRIRTNFSDEAEDAAITISQEEGEGIAIAEGDPDYVIDTTKPGGVVQQSLHSNREGGTEGVRHLQYELSGVTNSEPFRIYEITVDGFNMRGGGG